MTTTTSIKVNKHSLVWYNTQSGENLFSLEMKRTLRLPDDGKRYPLPPDLGSFRFKKVEDYKDKVPARWLEQGGVFVCLHQREAAWLSFSAKNSNPVAVKIAAGKVNAVDGSLWTNTLKTASSECKQDYLVCPPQPWLDGFNTGDSTVRQFVAMPLGQGYTVEKQVTGEEKHGGLQVMVFQPDPHKFSKPRQHGIELCSAKNIKHYGNSVIDFAPSDNSDDSDFEINWTASPQSCFAGSGGVTKSLSSNSMTAMPTIHSKVSALKTPPTRGVMAAEVGLAAGGKMEQQIYGDPHGIDVWDQSNFARIFIHIVNSTMWEQITGEKAPKSPISARNYTSSGFPWFDFYNETTSTISASDTLSKVKSIAEIDEENGIDIDDNDLIHIKSKQMKHITSSMKTFNPFDGNW